MASVHEEREREDCVRAACVHAARERAARVHAARVHAARGRAARGRAACVHVARVHAARVHAVRGRAARERAACVHVACVHVARGRAAREHAVCVHEANAHEARGREAHGRGGLGLGCTLVQYSHRHCSYKSSCRRSSCTRHYPESSQGHTAAEAPCSTCGLTSHSSRCSQRLLEDKAASTQNYRIAGEAMCLHLQERWQEPSRSTMMRLS